MSISREEFCRVLSLMQTSEKPFDVKDERIVFNAFGTEVDITLESQPDLVIGALRLPSFRVTICLEAEKFEAFKAHFDRTFQRGGG